MRIALIFCLTLASVAESLQNRKFEAGHSQCKDSGKKPSWESLSECTKLFDLDDDNCVNPFEFEYLYKNLIRNDDGMPDNFYPIGEKKMKMLFNTFDRDSDGFIDIEECRVCWDSWIEKIRHPISALIIVDVQNDFISGSLAIANSSEIIQPINSLVETVAFNFTVYTQDWHPENHISFIENVALRKFHTSSKIQDSNNVKVGDTVIFEGPTPTVQTLWPKHCVQNTFGAELHANLKIAKESTIIYKGTNSEIDSYSAFFDNNKSSPTKLHEELKARGITDVYLAGLAYEICVGETALDANKLGYKTIVIDDATKGVSSENVAKFQQQLKGQNGIIVSSDKVDAMVRGIDRRPELAIKLALDIQKKLQKTGNTVKANQKYM